MPEELAKQGEAREGCFGNLGGIDWCWTCDYRYFHIYDNSPRENGVVGTERVEEKSVDAGAWKRV